MKLKGLIFAFLLLAILAVCAGAFYRVSTTETICVSNLSSARLDEVNLSTSPHAVMIKSFELPPLERKRVKFRADGDASLTLTVKSNGKTSSLEHQGYVTTGIASESSFFIAPNLGITYSYGLGGCS